MKRIIASLFVIVSLCGISKANVVTLQFSGTYDTGGQTILGEEGSAVPYSYRLTYDTSLGSLLFHLPVGYEMGGNTTVQEWYGYSASGITATDLTFGSGSWDASGINARTVEAGYTADLWFDADLNVATPTSAWIYFDGPDNDNGVTDLQLGGGYTESGHDYLSTGESDVGDVISYDMIITAVPEPEVSTLVGLVLGVWAFSSKFKRVKA